MENQMEKLLGYFMKETDKKFEDVRDDLRTVKSRLDDLTKFKIEMMISARTTSLIVSILCGLITLTVSVWAATKGGR